MVRVKKTWKNAAVTVLVVAAVATATAAFYFNYAATATSACCASFTRFSSSLLSGRSDAASVTVEGPNRAKFSSTVLHASKMYSVCETRDYGGRRSAERVSF